MRVGGKLMKPELILLGLGGFAEADLVQGHNAVAGIAQGSNDVFPRGGAEVLAMQQNDRLAIGLRGPDIHVCHRQGLSLGPELVTLNGMGVVEIGQQGIRSGGLQRPARKQERQ
jgi:hypothetical protein